MSYIADVVKGDFRPRARELELSKDSARHLLAITGLIYYLMDPKSTRPLTLDFLASERDYVSSVCLSNTSFTF